MNEEYGSNLGFVRQTDGNIASVRQGQKPRKVKETSKSFSSLIDNIRYGRLSSCIKRYNEEYARLYELASKIDEQREAVDNGEMSYAEVRDSIDEYNMQAGRLAKIGVRVLAFDKQIQKIRFAKEEVAKGIKVPAFLIGPLKRLSKAGRDKARLEQEAKLEKETVLYDAIVQRAEEAIGQSQDSVVDADKFNSLSSDNLSQGVISQLIEDQEKHDSSDSAIDSEEERAKAEAEEIARKEAEEQARREAEEKVARRKATTDEMIKKVYEKSPSATKKREGTTEAKEAIASGDTFDILAALDKNYCTGRTQSKNGLVEVVAIKGEKVKVLQPSAFAQMVGLTGNDKKVVISAYNSIKDSIKLANLWSRVAAKSYTKTFSNGDVEVYGPDGTMTSKTEGSVPTNGEEVKTVSIKYEGSFDDDRKALFAFVSDSVKNGMSEEEIVAKANADLSSEEAAIVEKFVTGHLEIIQRGLSGTENLLQKDDNLEERKRQALDDALTKKAMAKYGHPIEQTPPEVEQTPTESEQTQEQTQQDVDSTPTEEVAQEEETEEEKAVVTPTDDSDYVSRIGALVGEIAEISKQRDELRKALGDEANSSIEKLNDLIASKLAEINQLALGGVVALGKNGEKDANVSMQGDEQPVVQEEHVNQSDETPVEAEKDEEHRDAIAWWSMMAPVLDDPDQQLLSRLEGAKADRERAERRAEEAIEKKKWEANRDARIAEGWLPSDEEARAKKIQEKEELAEKIARSKLKYIFLDDSAIDGMINESEELHNARDVLAMLAQKAPKAYAEMEENYKNDKLAQRAELQESHTEEESSKKM